MSVTFGAHGPAIRHRSDDRASEPRGDTDLVPHASCLRPPAVAAVFLFIPQLFGDGLGTIEGIAIVSLRQTVTPDALLGRVTATVHVLFEGIAPLGALLGAALALAYGSRETLFIAVCGMVLARAWLLFSPLGSLRQATVATGS